MPYFHVRVSQTQSETFVIEAANESAAEDAAIMFDIKKADKKVVLVHKDNSRAIDVSSGSKTDMTNALKQKRAK
jgi:hypothetical protein